MSTIANQTLQPAAADRRRASCAAWHALACATLCCITWCGSAAVARADLALAQRLSLRSSVGASLMLTDDQRGWLGYSAPGVHSDLQLALRLTPLIAAQAGAAGGIFFSGQANGALFAPMIGGSMHLPVAGLPTYAALNLGVAFTGAVVRPFVRASLGLDWPLSAQLSAGPMLGLDLVTQRDGAQYSSDALYAWIGLGLAFRAARSADPPVRKPIVRKRGVVLPPPAAEVIPDEVAPVIELPREHEPVAPPSAEIAQLIDEAVHVSRSELLAPVLFEFDSVELEPSSVAMLHEVARVLKEERKDIQLLAVIAYSDARGPAEYNLQLSERRARQVRDWLVRHGVAEQRLTLEARGASDPVEAQDHQQNRRVVFRVLRTESQP